MFPTYTPTIAYKEFYINEKVDGLPENSFKFEITEEKVKFCILTIDVKLNAHLFCGTGSFVYWVKYDETDQLNQVITLITHQSFSLLYGYMCAKDIYPPKIPVLDELFSRVLSSR